MQRWLRRLLVVAVVVAVVGAVVGLFVARWLERTLSPEGVAARVSTAIGHEVQIGSLDVYFSPWLRVRLGDVTIGSDAAFSAIEVGPDIASLLELRIEPGRFEIQDARVRIVRDEAGRIAFGESPPLQEPPTPPEAPPLSVLPQIEIEAATIELVDLSLGPEPVSTLLQLESVSFAPSLLTGRAELQGRARLGSTGERGRLDFAGQIEARDRFFELAIDAQELDLRQVLPYLESPLGPGRLEGVIEGRVEIDRSQADELLAELDLQLADGLVAFQGMEMAGPTRVAAHLAMRGGELSVRDLHFATENLTAPDAKDPLTRVELAVASLEVAGAGIGTGLPESAQMREASLAVTTLHGPLHLDVETCTLESLTEGQRARLTLDATLGSAPETVQARASVRAVSAPIGSGPAAVPGPFEVTLRVEDLDPALLVPIVPDFIAPRSRDPLSWTATFIGDPSEGFRGNAKLELRSGVLALEHTTFDGPAALEGVLAITPNGVTLEGAELQVARAKIGDRVAGGVRAGLSWNGEVLEVNGFSLETYSGALVVESQVDSTTPQVRITSAEQFSAFGQTTPWPLGELPWLLTPSDASLAGADVTVVDPAALAGEPVPLRIERADLRNFAVGEMPTLRISAGIGDPAGSRGQLEIEGRLRGLGEPGAALSGKVTARGLDPELLLSRAPAEWLLAGDPGPLDMDLTVREFQQGRLQADAEVRMPDGSVEVGDVRLAAPLRWRGEVSQAGDMTSIRDGHFEASSARTKDVELEALRADHGLEAETLSLDEVVWRAYAGAWQGKGTVELTDPPVFDITVQVDDADAHQMMGLDGESPKLRGSTKVRGSWHGVDRWLEGVEGSGQLELRGGELTGSQMIRAIWNALVGRIPVLGTWARSGSEAPRTRLQRAVLPFRVDGGRIRTDALQIATDDYRVTARGRLSQNLDLRLNGNVQLTAQGISRMLATGGVPSGLRQGLRLPSIPFEARGPVTGPTLRADVSAVPSAALGGLLGLPGRALDAARGVGGAALGVGRRAIPGRRSGTSAEERREEGAPAEELPTEKEGSPAGEPR